MIIDKNASNTQGRVLHEHDTTWNLKKTRHEKYIEKEDQFQSAIIIKFKIKAKNSKEKTQIILKRSFTKLQKIRESMKMILDNPNYESMKATQE